MSDFAFHPEAFTDLTEIWEFIAEDNVDAADRVIGEILDVLGSLAAFPHQGRRRPELTGRPLRFVLVREYLIANDADAIPVLVVAVLHG
jgi:plasmid stabilization system protein ParE